MFQASERGGWCGSKSVTVVGMRKNRWLWHPHRVINTSIVAAPVAGDAGRLAGYVAGKALRGMALGVKHTARGVKHQYDKSQQRQRGQSMAQPLVAQPGPGGEYPTGAWTQRAIPAVDGCRTPPGWSPFHRSRSEKTRAAIYQGMATPGVWQQGLIYPVPWQSTVDLEQGTDTGTRFVLDTGGEPMLLSGMEEYYILDKPNYNILVTGTSGQGKSVLQSHLVRYWAGAGMQPIIFSFKPHDVYSHMGFPVANLAQYLPDPFEDVDSLVEAMAVAYPMAQSGPTAASVGIALRGLAAQSTSWEDLIHKIIAEEKRTTDVVRRGALNLLRSQVEHLVAGGAQSFSLKELDHPLVLDFSRLSTPQQSFYGELALRQVWSAITSDQLASAVICFDEAHRILKGIDHSILEEIAREIRAFGALWVTTQAFTDLPDELKAQFATWFSFATHSPSDLKALRQLGPIYAEVGMLPNHCFTDLRWPVRHSHLPVFQLVAYQGAAVAPQPFVPPPKAVRYPDAMPQDLSGISLDLINDSGAINPSSLTEELAEHYSADKENVKPRVLKALDQLYKSEKVGKCKVELGTKDSMTLYYQRDPAESGLHRWLIDMVEQGLMKYQPNVTVNRAMTGVSSADLETPDTLYEIETGLKERGFADDLLPRLQRARKPVIIIVPNNEVLARYAGLPKTYPHVKVLRIMDWITEHEK